MITTEIWSIPTQAPSWIQPISENGLPTLGVFEKDRIITYCGGGIASTLTALALRLAGHQDVAVYDGSLREWAADPKLPLEL